MTPSFFTSSPYYLSIVYLFIPFFQFQELQMWPSTIGASKSCNNSQHYVASKSCKSKQRYMTSKGRKIKQCYCECFLYTSFLFNFCVVNLAKHNNKQNFHLDFTSTLKIGKSHLLFFLVRHGHVKISNLSMLLLPCHLSFYIYFDFCPPYRKKINEHHVF